MDDYESVLLVKSEVFVYRIPPRTTNRGYRAADWNLGTPDWTGRMRLVNRKNECLIKLEDKSSGELFAKCPIDKYPGVAIESVTDSSRYFVLRIQDEGGRAAFIGIGFGDRSDSFDLNVALQDHFKWKKEGQEGTSRPKPKAGPGGLGLLPPPPGGVKLAPPPGATTSPSSSSGDILEDLSGVSGNPVAQPGAAGGTGESWGDFASAAVKPPPPSSNPPSGGSGSGWVTF
ncbi:Adaptin ear-binding coat-associated protein 1-like [Homarus americanus]|uniref:Adaptin ear-binding coat-associated protein 1-like n=1 Tax=Homarus americanus TaxID=6706 RepID=A0A8J5JQ69_HOMAM|nr:Adaptin ear-binding coat-associated protein 1-like [Homarus americanus]